MKVIGIVLFVLFPIGILAAETITDANWSSHPEIKKIRGLYNEINSLEKANKLKKETQKVCS